LFRESLERDRSAPRPGSGWAAFSADGAAIRMRLSNCDEPRLGRRIGCCCTTPTCSSVPRRMPWV
jgi:hypothetical protein